MTKNVNKMMNSENNLNEFESKIKGPDCVGSNGAMLKIVKKEDLKYIESQNLHSGSQKISAM